MQARDFFLGGGGGEFAGFVLEVVSADMIVDLWK